MPRTSSETAALADEVLLHRLADLLENTAPGDPAPWNLLATLAPEQTELRARAARLIQTYAALQQHRGAGPPWLRRGRALAGATAARWRWGALVAALLAVTGIAYAAWSRAGRDSPEAPVAADPPFPRPFPLTTTESGRVVTYQHGRLTGLHVMRAPATIDMAIGADGLQPWVGPGRFHSAWAAPYARQYYLDGCLLMDDRYLYIGAVVGDPWPMCSACAPQPSADGGWSGGSIQVRLATDLDQLWPVRPTHAADKLFHLTLWSFQGQAYLHIARGMAFATPVTPLRSPAEGFVANFRKTDDALGYVVKCRVPWHLVGLDAAPYGRELGLSWDVLWSDPHGREFVGKLTDFYHSPALHALRDRVAVAELLPGKLTYQTATIWGKAVCPPAR